MSGPGFEVLVKIDPFMLLDPCFTEDVFFTALVYEDGLVEHAIAEIATIPFSK